MAFDAVASTGGSRGRKAAGDVAEESGTLLSSMSQRVWTLVQTLASMNKLADQLGTPTDTLSFRQRLVAMETKVDKMRVEIDAGIRRLRVEAAEKGDTYTLKSVERLSDQYNEVRKQTIDSLKTSQAKQRQFSPHPDPQNERVVTNKMRDEGMEMSSIQIRALHDVDAAIDEERRLEAALIAQEAIAVNNIARDIGGLVQQQGETLTKVEEQVDTTKNNVVRGNEDLMKAASYQKSYRKKCMFFMLVLLIIIAVVLVPVLLHVVPGK